MQKAKYERLLDSVSWLSAESPLGDRILALAPALADLLHGRTPDHKAIIWRNVALHAAVQLGVRISTATVAELKYLQEGPRLPVQSLLDPEHGVPDLHITLGISFALFV